MLTFEHAFLLKVAGVWIKLYNQKKLSRQRKRMLFVNNWELLARYFTKVYFVSLEATLFLAQLTKCLTRNLFVSVLFLAENRISDSRLYMLTKAVREMGFLKRLTRYFTNMTCPCSKTLITFDKQYENTMKKKYFIRLWNLLTSVVCLKQTGTVF